MILPGEVVTHREALAGLLKDPRVVTGTLLGGGWRARQFAFRVRSKRGRVISAASPFHAVHRPTSAFLGVLKVAAADRPALATSAARLAELAAEPPQEWRDELARKRDMWRNGLWRASQRGEDEAEEAEGEDEPADDLEDAPREEPAPEDIELSPEDEARLREKLAAAPEDSAALALVGLVRSGTHVGVNRLRRLFWARPLSAEAAAEAELKILDYDEDKVLLDSAVKASDGFFTTFFVSTYSRYIARWAARRGFTPNQVTTVSLFIGILAAAGVRHRASAGGWSPARSCCRPRSRPTASTASSPATRGRSPSSARGWTRSSTARRSTSASPASRSGRAARATRSGRSRAPRSRCRPRGTSPTSPSAPGRRG